MGVVASAPSTRRNPKLPPYSNTGVEITPVHIFEAHYAKELCL